MRLAVKGQLLYCMMCREKGKNEFNVLQGQYNFFLEFTLHYCDKPVKASTVKGVLDFIFKI